MSEYGKPTAEGGGLLAFGLTPSQRFGEWKVRWSNLEMGSIWDYFHTNGLGVASVFSGPTDLKEHLRFFTI